MNAVKTLVLATTLSITPIIAQAKGIFIINTGDEMFEVNAIEQLTEDWGNGWKVGYKCSHLGIMWADIWTWNCKIAAVNLLEDSYDDLPENILTTVSGKYTMRNAVRGSWNHYGVFGILASLATFAYIRRRA